MRVVTQENERETMKKANTGKQIKNFADLVRYLGMAVAIMAGLYFFESNSIFAIIFVAVGCYAAWASTLLLHGFGDLIEETAANRANTDRIVFLLESQQRNQQSDHTAK